MGLTRIHFNVVRVSCHVMGILGAMGGNARCRLMQFLNIVDILHIGSHICPTSYHIIIGVFSGFTTRANR